MQHVLRLSSEDIAAELCSNHGLHVQENYVKMKTAVVFNEKDGIDTLCGDSAWVGGWPHPQKFMEGYLLYGKWGISTG